jgi:hypothetical protein
MSHRPAKCIEDPSTLEKPIIWPIFQIYHMPWQTIRQLNALLDK